MDTDHVRSDNPTFSATNSGETTTWKKEVRHFTYEPYPMNVPGRKRGIARIFSHAKFLISGIPPRRGTAFDNNRLTSVLNDFGFEMKLCQDYTRDEIFQELWEVSEMDHSNNECLAIFVMSHGDCGRLLARDKHYDVSKLWSYFTQSKCPTLKGKPKLFFIQSCRGEKVDAGTYIRFQSNYYKRTSPLSSLGVPDAVTIDAHKPAYTEIYETPDEPDFLVAYSTVPDHASYNNPTKGSWFIQELCHMLEERGRNYNLLTLLTLVAQEIAINCTSSSCNALIDNKKQIPSTLSTLERPLYFFPAEIEKVPYKIQF